MVGGVLRHGILGAARPAQPLDRLRIAGRAVEGEAHQVGGVAVELAARLAVGREVLDGLAVLLEAEPRLGDDALDLRPARRHGAPRQGLALGDDITVVALVELDLKQVVRHQIAVGGAAAEPLEALLRTAVLPFGVIDIGFVIERMVGIGTLRRDAVEEVVGLGVVALREGSIARTNVVLLAARRAQPAAVDAPQRLARPGHLPFGAVERTEREAHVVGMDRTRIGRLEGAQRGSGILGAQLHGTDGEVVVGLQPLATVVGRKRRTGREEFVPGIAPAAESEEFPAPLERGPDFGRRGPGLSGEEAERRGDRYEVIAHMNEVLHR